MTHIGQFRIQRPLRRRAPLLAACLALLALFATSLRAAEFEAEDRLTSNGYALLKSSAQVVGLLGISTGAPQAALDIVSTGTLVTQYAQVWRDSTGLVVASMTANGKLSTLQALPGDNLGSHTAAQDLNLAGYDIVNASSIAVAANKPGLTVSTNIYVMNGDMGIGTSAPEAKLHISADTASGSPVERIILDGQTQSTTASGSGQLLAFKSGASYFGAVGGYGNGSSTGIGLWAGVGSGYPGLYITSQGNVGIGTPGPGARLTLRAQAQTGNVVNLEDTSGFSRAIIGLSSGSGNLGLRDSGGNLNVDLESGGDSYINSGGNFGIGTNAPSAGFHVQKYTAAAYTAVISTSATAGVYSVAVTSTGVTNINNLVIENRTSDPVAPVTGQIWLRVN